MLPAPSLALVKLLIVSWRALDPLLFTFLLPSMLALSFTLLIFSFCGRLVKPCSPGTLAPGQVSIPQARGFDMLTTPSCWARALVDVGMCLICYLVLCSLGPGTLPRDLEGMEKDKYTGTCTIKLGLGGVLSSTPEPRGRGGSCSC